MGGAINVFLLNNIEITEGKAGADVIVSKVVEELQNKGIDI